MLMTNKNLARRLERLEALLLPATEERILILNFITGDGEVVGKRSLNSQQIGDRLKEIAAGSDECNPKASSAPRRTS